VFVALFSAPVETEPEVACVPTHSPEAVQLVASVDDHVKVEADPETTVAGEAEIETVGTETLGLHVG
jgi:hypothetical protein